MQQLPRDKYLPVEKLAACFNNTSATYKFYWLLSIVDALEARIESEVTTIPKTELFARMISNAWYIVNYFRVSFGKQDKLQQAISEIRKLENITVDADKQDIIKTLVHSSKPKTVSVLRQFNNQVPHWFLSPWFPGGDRRAIYAGSQSGMSNSLYALDEKFIRIGLLWANYLLVNARLLKDFCHWNLVLFLQKNNPNVPDIAGKIFKPPVRGNLLKQRRFWDLVMNERKAIPCVYTGRPLQGSDFAVEHFVPYNFIPHNLIWNLIPADKLFNSRKSDRLPDMQKHFDPFFNLQLDAIRIVRKEDPSNKLLEDYLTLFSSLEEAEGPDAKDRFRDTIQPLITIAANNGFQFLDV
jgi:hypothetical protein